MADDLRAEALHRSDRRCRVVEEWAGHFIGRRWCSVHEVRWDGGGPCPGARALDGEAHRG